MLIESSSSRGSEPASIIYFGNDYFAENRTSSHHIGLRLAKRFPLLYVESPGFRAPKVNAEDATKIWRKLKGAFRLPVKVADQTWHMIVPQIPYRGLPFVSRLNEWIAVLLLNRAVRRLGMKRRLLWFATPDMGAIAGRLGEEFVVYYVTDEHSCMPGVNAEAMADLDLTLTRRANQVFVCSPAMIESRTRLNPSTTYSPHGVDVSLFQTAASPDLAVAEGARNLPRPVIGFIGTIEAWVDLDLIAAMAKARPDWTFLMIGRVGTDIRALASSPNVVFTGPQKYETLPSWVKAFDVCIIPFRQTELVRNINPLKLREYLATGKPVVSVPMPEVQKLAEHVTICSGEPTTFLDALERAIADDNERGRELRMNAVASMTWDARVAEALEIVQRRKSQAATCR